MGRALFFSGLRLGIGPAFSVVFFTVICALFDPIDVLTKHMNPAGIEDSSSSGAEKAHETTAASTSKDKYASDVAKGKRPL